MVRCLALALIAVASVAVPAAGVVVDHGSVDDVASLPQSTMDAIGLQKWFFSHASVGGNMTAGMTDLRTANPTRYKLVVTSAGYNGTLLRANNPPSPTLDGRIYDCSRGNPDWSAKLTIFDNSVRIAGWHESAVNVAMDKFCYIDQTASAASYISTMTALEAAYPTTVFVYITMPLTTDEDSNNVLRNQYNTAVGTSASATISFCMTLLTWRPTTRRATSTRSFPAARRTRNCTAVTRPTAGT